MRALSNIVHYPLKSTAGINLETGIVTLKGLAHDRRWALVDEENRVMTGRKHPDLLAIESRVYDDHLEISLPKRPPLTIPLKSIAREIIRPKLFDSEIKGNHISTEVDHAISDFLGVSCRMIFMDEGCDRQMKKRSASQATAEVSYADSAPLLLTTEASLDELNGMLKKEDRVSMKNFRPNLVIKGCTANEETLWKRIKIGEVIFKVHEECKRCIFITIDPETKLKNKNQEPLRTLATYKQHQRGGVAFGLLLIPQNTGTISIGDQLEVLQRS